jgi:hypothetical protein
VNLYPSVKLAHTLSFDSLRPFKEALLDVVTRQQEEDRLNAERLEVKEKEAAKDWAAYGERTGLRERSAATGTGTSILHTRHFGTVKLIQSGHSDLALLLRGVERQASNGFLSPHPSSTTARESRSPSVVSSAHSGQSGSDSGGNRKMKAQEFGRCVSS